MKLFRLSESQRPLAVRSTAVAVCSALVLAALGSVGLTVAFDDSVASGLVTFAMFGGLCECGRRLLELRPVPIGRHVARAFWLALGAFGLMMLIDALLTWGR